MPLSQVETINDLADRSIGSAIEFGKDPTTGDPVVEVVDPQFCFAAGTLVHTSTGLVPIEDICEGDLVLSQPEGGGEQGYKRVLGAVVHEDKEVILVSYVVGKEKKPRHLIVTGNHPLWVVGQGWTRADLMSGGAIVKLRDDREALVFMARPIFRTDEEGIGWTSLEGFDEGTTIDFRGERIEIGDERSVNESAFDDLGVVTQTVYNFEVEELHTYYVGELGVWAHDTTAARPRAPSRA